MDPNRIFADPYEEVVNRMDREKALSSDCLTAKQRQVVALVDYACLKEKEAGEVLGITQQAVSDSYKSSARSINAFLDGRGMSRSQKFTPAPEDGTATIRWLNYVGANMPNWWDVPSCIRKEVLDRFDQIGEYVENSEKSAYKILSDNQMRHQTRNQETPKPVIHPRYFGNGRKKGTSSSTKKIIV